MTSIFEMIFKSSQNEVINTNLSICIPYMFDPLIATFDIFLKQIHYLTKKTNPDLNPSQLWDHMVEAFIVEARRIGERFIKDEFILMDFNVKRIAIHKKVLQGSGYVSASVKSPRRMEDVHISEELIRDLFHLKHNIKSIKDFQIQLSRVAVKIEDLNQLLKVVKENSIEQALEYASEGPASLETVISPGLHVRGINIPSENYYDGLDLIHKSVSILKKRNVDLRFLESLGAVYLSSEVLDLNPNHTLGMYLNADKDIVINLPALQKASINTGNNGNKVLGKILNNFKYSTYSGSYENVVPYAFIHELAHHIYYRYLNSESISYWEEQFAYGTSLQDLEEDYLKFNSNYPHYKQNFFQKLYNFYLQHEKLSYGEFARILTAWLESLANSEEIPDYWIALSAGLIQAKISDSERDPIIKVKINNSEVKNIYNEGPNYIFKLNASVPLNSHMSFEIFELLFKIKKQGGPSVSLAVTDYGASSDSEDFAEAFVWYVLKPDVLTKEKQNRLLRCLYLSDLVNNGTFRFAALSAISKKVTYKYLNSLNQ